MVSSGPSSVALCEYCKQLSFAEVCSYRGQTLLPKIDLPGEGASQGCQLCTLITRGAFRQYKIGKGVERIDVANGLKRLLQDRTTNRAITSGLHGQTMAPLKLTRSSRPLKMNGKRCRQFANTTH